MFLVIWYGMTTRASLWLYRLTADVFHMSYRLLLYYCLRALANGKIYFQESKILAVSYWKAFLNFLSNKRGNIGWGRSKNDRKYPFGLENNIPLPLTGEEAMKRLLAGRGKDPYSILGVTRDCSDEDIRRYYKRQAFLVHPDKNKQPGAEEAFKILAHAFEIIGEPVSFLYLLKLYLITLIVKYFPPL